MDDEGDGGEEGEEICLKISTELSSTRILFFIVVSLSLDNLAEMMLSKKTQKWLENATSITEMLGIFKRCLMIKTRVCPRLCAGCLTRWVRLKL